MRRLATLSRWRRVTFASASGCALLVLLMWVGSNIWHLSYVGGSGWAASVVRGQFSGSRFTRLSKSRFSWPEDDEWSAKRLPDFRPHWRAVRYRDEPEAGLATVSIGLWVPGSVAACIALATLDPLIRHRKGRCKVCGYSLAGLPERSACPECGVSAQ